MKDRIIEWIATTQLDHTEAAVWGILFTAWAMFVWHTARMQFGRPRQ